MFTRSECYGAAVFSSKEGEVEMKKFELNGFAEMTSEETQAVEGGWHILRLYKKTI
jgi:hypothetical protein